MLFFEKNIDDVPILWYSIQARRDLGLFFMLKKWHKKENTNGMKYRRNGRGGGKMRTKITLACTECKNRNYNLTKDKKTHPDRMETNKYCRFCKTHTLHKETK